jgi:D-alanyl-D-alanine carboxypeptidase
VNRRRSQHTSRGQSRPRRSSRSTSAVVVSGLVLAAVLSVALWQVWRVLEQQRREAAAWRRVGSCKGVGDSNLVECTGVKLVDLAVSPKIASCGRFGYCTVKINREAKPAFESALAEIVRADVGSSVTKFETVNRRRCRNAITGAWIAGCVSKHSYGIAVDFRPFADNANWEQVTDRDPGVSEVVKIFRSHGFRWGGTFDNYDPQHLEWIPR